MVDKAYLQDLLAILKTHNVKHLKMNGLELTFHVEQSQALPGITGSTDSAESDKSSRIIAETIKKQEATLPPDLRADSLMDQDKILNWSSPDQKPFEEDQELPLTGEQPL